jgi:hypothetical protein
MPFLLGAIPWRLVAIIGVVAGLLFGAMWVTSQIKKVGRLEAQLDNAIEVSNQNAAIAEQYRKEIEDMQKTVAEGAKKKAGIRTQADKRRKVINDTLPEDDAPLAPVLRNALDGLRPDPETDRVHTGS